MGKPTEQVVHPHWGSGVVERVTADTVTVLFHAAGYKVLSLDIL
jgi:hypothetical protein